MFTTSEGLFELIVMFFKLINFPAIFQIIMNGILLRLINTREVTSFFDDIIVRIKEEECYKLHSACISTTSRPIFTN